MICQLLKIFQRIKEKKEADNLFMPNFFKLLLGLIEKF